MDVKLESLDTNTHTWIDPDEDIEIRVKNCDSRKKAREKLKLFIDKIRRQPTFKKHIKIG